MLKMPKKSIKFISEFLEPSLNEERFGKRLMWLDKEKAIFQIDWCHKGGPRWTEREAEVFVEWDKHKGHYHPEEKMYFTQSKQRFRALLYKLSCEGKIIQLQSPNKFMKVYSIGEKKMKRRKRSSISSASDSSEYEMFEPSLHEMCDIIDSEGEYRRRVSDDSTKNIMEDHSYTSVDYQSGTDKDQFGKFLLLDIPDLTTGQELINSSSERVLVRWNYPFNNPNDRMASLQESTSIPSEEVLVELNYPCIELNDSLALLQKSTNSPLEKLLVKQNCPYEQNHCLYSLQESTNNPLEKVLVKLNLGCPYNGLNNSLSFNNADLFFMPKDSMYEATNKSSQNAILKLQDDLNSDSPNNATHINLWKYSKENEAPFDDPMIAQNDDIHQDMGLTFESDLSLPVFTNTNLDLAEFLC